MNSKLGLYFIWRFSLCWGRNKARSRFSTYSITPSCPGRGGGASPWLLVRFTQCDINVDHFLHAHITHKKQRILHPKKFRHQTINKGDNSTVVWHNSVCFFPFWSRGNGLLPRLGECMRPRYHVLLLRTLCRRTSLPEISVVEEVHDRHPACMSPF